jgi:hypothetical protein
MQMTGFKAILAGSAALVLAAAGASAQTASQGAQDHALSEQEVQNFFRDTEQTITQAMKSGDFAAVQEWAAKHVAEDAAFSPTIEFFGGGERKGFTSLTLNKDDMMKVGGIVGGVLSGPNRQGIEDYSLEITMTDFKHIVPNAALVKTEIRERGRLAFPDTPVAAAGGDKTRATAMKTAPAIDTRPRAQAGSGAEMEGIARCVHVIQRSDQPSEFRELQMGLTTCQIEAHFD